MQFSTTHLRVANRSVTGAPHSNKWWFRSSALSLAGHHTILESEACHGIIGRSRDNRKNWNRAKPRKKSRNIADPGKFGVFVEFKWGFCLQGFEKYHPLLVTSAKDVQNHEDTVQCSQASSASVFSLGRDGRQV